MQTKFKVGDKVRCVANDHYESHLTVGKVYTVLSISWGYGKCYLRIKPDGVLDVGGYSDLKFELAESEPVLTPEEVFEHLRKGTKLERQRKDVPSRWVSVDHAVYIHQVDDYYWRIKPEPEIIELNGKRYKLIEE